MSKKPTKDAPDLAVQGVQELTADMFEGMTIDQVVSLKDGEAIKGIFRGKGETVEVENTDKDGNTEKKPIDTWRIETAPGRISCVVSSAQLDRKMPTIEEGSIVCIGRLGVEKTRKGQQITRFVVGVEPATDKPAALPPAAA